MVTSSSPAEASYSTARLSISTSAARTAASGVFISWAMLAVIRPRVAIFSALSSRCWLSWSAPYASCSSAGADLELLDQEGNLERAADLFAQGSRRRCRRTWPISKIA